MPKGDRGDLQRAQEQTYERLRTHGGADREVSKALAEKARDRLERKHDEGRGPLSPEDSKK